MNSYQLFNIQTRQFKRISQTEYLSMLQRGSGETIAETKVATVDKISFAWRDIETAIDMIIMRELHWKYNIYKGAMQND